MLAWLLGVLLLIGAMLAYYAPQLDSGIRAALKRWARWLLRDEAALREAALAAEARVRTLDLEQCQRSIANLCQQLEVIAPSQAQLDRDDAAADALTQSESESIERDLCVMNAALRKYLRATAELSGAMDLPRDVGLGQARAFTHPFWPLTTQGSCDFGNVPDPEHIELQHAEAAMLNEGGMLHD